MKFSFTLSILLALGTGVVAQNNWWFNLPTCSLKCALAASAGSGCDLSDLKCICKSDKFKASFNACLLQNCATSGGPQAQDKFKKACTNDTVTDTVPPSTQIATSTVLPSTVTLWPNSTLPPSTVTGWPNSTLPASTQFTTTQLVPTSA